MFPDILAVIILVFLPRRSSMCGAESISAGYVDYIKLFDRSVWLSSDAQVQRKRAKTRGFRLTRIHWKLQARASVFAQKRNISYVLEYDIINTHLTSPPSTPQPHHNDVAPPFSLAHVVLLSVFLRTAKSVAVQSNGTPAL